MAAIGRRSGHGEVGLLAIPPPRVHQPYAKLGYGVTWFHLENASVGGVVLSQPKTETVHPFTWHWGLGVEFLPIASFVPPPRGMDVGVRLEYAQFRHSLALGQQVETGSALGVPPDVGVMRHAVTLAVTIGL